MDIFTNTHLIARWLHVFAGIIWIGILYFFNFINVPFQAAIDDATKKGANPQLMPRALWWFRWGAMVTFLAGLILFVLNYFYIPQPGPGMGSFGPTYLLMDEGGMTQRGMWILFGMLLGTIMWFNVWFVIWPTQKGILTGRFQGEELAAARKRALLFSRINTYLSGPMLFGMLAPAHYGTMQGGPFLLFVALAAGAVWLAIFHSSKVGTSV